MILDIDATLVTAHSDKEGAAGTYKGGYGFNPLVCFEAATREAMSALLRPGNAGSNNAWDHVEVLCLALEQLPAGIDPRSVLVRCDSAGATHLLTDTASELGLRFSVGFDLTEPVRSAILRCPRRPGRPRSAPTTARAMALGSPSSRILTSRPGRLGRARSAAANGPTPARSCRLAITTGTASGSSSPTRPAGGSRGSSRSTASARASRTRSAAPKTAACATCLSAPSSRTLSGSSSCSWART